MAARPRQARQARRGNVFAGVEVVLEQLREGQEELSATINRQAGTLNQLTAGLNQLAATTNQLAAMANQHDIILQQVQPTLNRILLQLADLQRQVDPNGVNNILMPVEERNRIATTHNGCCRVQEELVCILKADGQHPPFFPRLKEDIFEYSTAQLEVLLRFYGETVPRRKEDRRNKLCRYYGI